jgi:hypothetical protein
MIKVLATLAAVASVLLQGTITYGQGAEGRYQGFELTIRTEKATFTNREPITVILSLKNVSSEPLWVMEHGLKEKNFKVVNERDEIIPNKTQEALARGGITEISDWNPPVFKAEILPGAERKVESNLRFFYNLDKPGKYKLRAVRDVPIRSSGTNSDAFTNLVSKPVEITIRSE